MDNEALESLRLSEPESEVQRASFVYNGVVYDHQWIVTPAGLLTYDCVTHTPLPLVGKKP
jgi:hypothetical protein